MPRLRKADREAFWRKLVAEQRSSNRTVEQVCRQAGVSTASFYAWRQRLKATNRGASLVPVRIVESVDDGRTATPTGDGDSREHGQGTAGDRAEGQLIVELGDVVQGRAPAVRIRIPSGCDEDSIDRVMRAVLKVLGQGRSSC